MTEPARFVRMRRSPLARVGRRAKSKRAVRAQVVARVLARDGYRCQAYKRIVAVLGRFAGPVTCAGPLDVHEIVPRSVWPDGELVDDNCVSVCRRHHEWIDEHPALAREVGLHKFSWDRRSA